MLRSKKLTLLDPASWEDKADARFMARYKEQSALRCVAAVCFSMASETFHHWRIFSHGAAGVRVSFRTQPFLKAIDSATGVTHGVVRYLKVAETGTSRVRIDRLPFVKRYAYRDEQEYRIVYSSSRRTQGPIPLRVPVKCIDRITVSPWLDKARYEAVAATLHAIPGCSRLQVARSRLMDNDQWLRFGDLAT
jgi:hypothetical protein